MKIFIRNSLCVLLGIALALSIIIPPHASANQSSNEPDAQGYDEYLDMLLATGQYGKYEKFIKISDPADYKKHISNFTVWKNGYPSEVAPSHPMHAMKSVAETYGFTSPNDTFILLPESDNKAWIKVSHYNRTYYASLEKVNGAWQVNSVYNI